MRNGIFHKTDSADAKMASKHPTEELRDSKYNVTKYLRYGDRGRIDYSATEIMCWTNKQTEGLLKMLRRWRQQY